MSPMPILPPEPTLADKVNELAARVVQLDLERQAAMGLLGEIVATMTLPANRTRIGDCRDGQESHKTINALLAAFDHYAARYRELAGGK